MSNSLIFLCWDWVKVGPALRKRAPKRVQSWECTLRLWMLKDKLVLRDNQFDPLIGCPATWGIVVGNGHLPS